jgi:hypothetical protein
MSGGAKEKPRRVYVQAVIRDGELHIQARDTALLKRVVRGSWIERYLGTHVTRRKRDALRSGKPIALRVDLVSLEGLEKE